MGNILLYQDLYGSTINNLYFTLCKRPLNVNIIDIDRPCLEKTHSNLYHFHFFIK